MNQHQILLLAEELDRRLRSEGGGCDHSLRWTRRFLTEQGMDVESEVTKLERLGAYCDCEFMFNVYVPLCEDGDHAAAGVCALLEDDGAIARCRDLVLTAKHHVREADIFLTSLSAERTPRRALGSLRAAREGVVASCEAVIRELQGGAWGEAKLSTEQDTRDMSGWDQHLLTPEQYDVLWAIATEREAALIAEHQRQHPNEKHCEECGGIGFEHSDGSYGLYIRACPVCGKFASHAAAVAAHRAACRCAFPEFDPYDPWHRHITVEKGHELQDVCCPACGQTRTFRLAVKHRVLVHERRLVELDQIGFDGKTPTECVACGHTGALEQFAPSV